MKLSMGHTADMYSKGNEDPYDGIAWINVNVQSPSVNMLHESVISSNHRKKHQLECHR